MHRPRVPAQQEVSALQTILIEDLGPESIPSDHEEHTNIGKLINTASIAVFDNYVTDATSTLQQYKGRLMSVVWPMGPKTHEVFGWQGEKLQSLTRCMG